MTLAVVFLVGFLVGSIPTADMLGRMWGVDLRAAGSGNPGTNNALRQGGRALGAAVLLVEMGKGALAVWLGRWLGQDGGGGLAAIGATAGNVYNPWFHFRGGKGLAITGGTLVAAWPLLVPLLAGVIAGSLAVWRRSGPATLITFAVYLVAAATGLVVDLPTGWGLGRPGWIAIMAGGAVAMMLPKHFVDTLRPDARTPTPT